MLETHCNFTVMVTNPEVRMMDSWSGRRSRYQGSSKSRRSHENGRRRPKMLFFLLVSQLFDTDFSGIWSGCRRWRFVFLSWTHSNRTTPNKGSIFSLGVTGECVESWEMIRSLDEAFPATRSKKNDLHCVSLRWSWDKKKNDLHWVTLRIEWVPVVKKTEILGESLVSYRFS